MKLPATLFVFSVKKTRLLKLGIFGVILAFLVSCTSTTGQQTVQKVLSSDTDVLLFTLSQVNNSFLNRDINFVIDEEKRQIQLDLKISDIAENKSINAQTRFTIDIAIPSGASLVINGEIIRDQTTISVFLAKGFFEGRALPLTVIAENQVDRGRYTIVSQFQKPTFSFGYGRRSYRFKIEEAEAIIPAPRVRGTATGVPFFSISPNDAIVSLEDDGSLILRPSVDMTEETTQRYTIRGQNQGVRFARRLNLTFYPNQAPSEPIVIQPANEATDIDRNENIILSWTTSEDPDKDAVNYQVLVSSNGNLFSETALSSLYQRETSLNLGKSEYTFNTNITNNLYVINSKVLNPDATYFWKVIASDGYTQVESETYTFATKINNIPEEFSLIAPMDQEDISIIPNEELEFLWSVSEDPDDDVIEYVFYLSSDVNALRQTVRASIENQGRVVIKTSDQHIIEETVLTTNVYTIPSSRLTPNTTFYWTVKSTDGFSERVGGVRSFRTAYDPNTISILSPLDNSGRVSTQNLELAWIPPTDELNLPLDLNYTVYFSGNERDVILESLETLVTQDSTNTRVRVDDKLRSLTTYYWKVISYHEEESTADGGAGNNNEELDEIPPDFISALNSFTTTNRPPTRPRLTYPPNNATELPRVNDIYLSWDQSIDFDFDPLSYTLYFSPVQSDLFVEDDQFIIARNISELEYAVPAENLEAETTYYWKIVASDPHVSVSSPVYSFTTSKNLKPLLPKFSTLSPYESNEEGLQVETPYSEGISFTWGKPFYVEGDEFYQVLVDTNKDNLNEFSAAIISQPTDKLSIDLPGNVFLPRQMYYWKLIITDRYGEQVEMEDSMSFHTVGFSLEVNPEIVSARRANNVSFILDLANDNAAEQGYAYTYTLDDSQGNTPTVRGEGLISERLTRQPLNIAQLGQGDLTLNVRVFRRETGGTIETLTAVVKQSSFIKVTRARTLSRLGRVPSLPLTATYTLMNNIDLSQEANFSPIGGAGGGEAPFTGKLYGQNYTISGLTINQSQQDGVGLFSTITDGEIIDVNIQSSAQGIQGSSATGILAGSITGRSRVQNVRISGTVLGKDQVGGVGGRINGKTTLRNVTTVGSIRGSDSIGGLGGRVYSGVIITNSKSSARVSGNDDIGGLIGRGIDISIERSSAVNVVEGRNNVGGIAGSLVQGRINNSLTQSQIKGSSSVGGLSGWLSGGGTTNSFTRSEITGLAEVGGIIGYTLGESVISNTYSESRISGRNKVGGISGRIADESQIINSYVRGTLIPLQQNSDEDIPFFGGVAGELNGDITLRNNFYSVVSVEPIRSANLPLTEETRSILETSSRGLNASSFKQSGTFRDWDFTSTWELNATTNDGFPFLKTNSPN